LNALIRRAAMARRGVEAVETARVREISAGNGCPAMRSPCIGLETEAERRSRRSNGFAKLSCAVAKVQVGDGARVEWKHTGMSNAEEDALQI